MKLSSSKISSKSGSVLLVTLMLSAIIGMTLGGYLIMALSQNRSVVRSQTWNSSIAMTEAGVEDALQLLNKYSGNFDQVTNWPSSAWYDNWSLIASNVYYVRRYIGENYYDVVDDSPIAPMPDKLVKYIEHLVSLEDAKKVKPESASTSTVDLDSPFIHHQIHPRLVTLAGYYVQNKNISDADELYTLLIARIEKNGCFYEDGITSFPYDNKKVRQVAESAVQSWKTGEQKKLESQLTLNQQPATATPVDVSDWRDQFRSVGEMEDGPIDMIIEGALQEGTCFIGANPGDGKTLVGLAFAKAISTGEPLFGIPQFCVKQPRTVIYLIPESRDRAFRKSCEAFRIPNDKMKFMARTISAGVSLELSDPRLLKAVNQTKAVVFLDTASRFMKGSDENAAAQNRQLVNDVIALLAAGAVCVVLVHHATKAAKANQERMTLENMLRGTSDFGAMCDQAYGIRKDMNLYSNGSGPMEIDLVSLKDREQIGGLTSIRLAASYKVKYTEKGRIETTFPVSCINETGNFSVVSDSETSRREVQALEAMVKEDPNIPAKDIAERVGITEYRVKNQLTRLGWHRVQGGLGGASPWHKDAGGSCPYDKVVEVKPSKKTLDTTVTEVVGNLRDLLKDTSPTGDYVPETEVLSWADKRGITETVLNKAKRRLGVVVNKDGDIKTWALPVTPEGVEAA